MNKFRLKLININSLVVKYHFYYFYQFQFKMGMSLVVSFLVTCMTMSAVAVVSGKESYTNAAQTSLANKNEL